MLSRRSDAIPLEALRDAIGLCRAMYRAEQASTRPSSERLAVLAQIGRDLTEAHELAAQHRPATVGHYAAWQRAEDALARLCACVGAYDTTEPIVTAARRAVSRMPVPGVRGQREER